MPIRQNNVWHIFFAFFFSKNILHTTNIEWDAYICKPYTMTIVKHLHKIHCQLLIDFFFPEASRVTSDNFQLCACLVPFYPKFPIKNLLRRCFRFCGLWNNCERGKPILVELNVWCHHFVGWSYIFTPSYISTEWREFRSTMFLKVNFSNCTRNFY